MDRPVTTRAGAPDPDELAAAARRVEADCAAIVMRAHRERLGEGAALVALVAYLSGQPTAVVELATRLLRLKLANGGRPGDRGA